MCERTSQFLKNNRYVLFIMLCLTVDVGVFIAGIILFKKGLSIPTGELYQCDNESFQLVADEQYMQDLHRRLENSCSFLSLCAANFTSNIMTALCAKPCEGLFVSTNTTDTMLVRACSSNQDIGSGTMMAVWSGAILFCAVLCCCCSPDKVLKSLDELHSSYREIFFPYRRPVAPMMEGQEMSCNYV